MFKIILAIGVVGAGLIAYGIAMCVLYGKVPEDSEEYTQAFASVVAGFVGIIAGIFMVTICIGATKCCHKEYEYFDKCFDYSGTVEYKENDEVVSVKIPLKPDAKLEYNAEEGCFYYTP